MPKILVIADDFTGAAEIGGIAHLFGLSVNIQTSHTDHDKIENDVIVIDTNTRSLSPEEAYKILQSILKDLDLSAFDFIYKKVDSVLRGPIASEVKAILSMTNLKKAILVPANPSKDRTIKNGKYYIHGVPIDQTEFQYDPEYPRNSAMVRDLIIDGFEAKTPDHPNEKDHSIKLEIPDAYSDDMLKEIVNTRLTKYCLAAGGADFFTAIMIHKFKLKKAIPVSYLPAGGRRHFIIGTRSINGTSTINTLQGRGYTCFFLPEQSLESHRVYNIFSEKIISALDRGQAIIIARPEIELSGPLVLRRIIQLLSKTAGVLINKSSSGDEIFIEGGETASTIVRNQGVNLKIREVLEIGVVKLELNYSGICLIVKPGSYPWPKNIFEPSTDA